MDGAEDLVLMHVPALRAPAIMRAVEEGRVAGEEVEPGGAGQVNVDGGGEGRVDAEADGGETGVEAAAAEFVTWVLARAVDVDDARAGAVGAGIGVVVGIGEDEVIVEDLGADGEEEEGEEEEVAGGERGQGNVRAVRRRVGEVGMEQDLLDDL